MRISYKAEIRLQDETDEKKSTFLRATVAVNDFSKKDPTVADLKAVGSDLLLSEKFASANYVKVKEEVWTRTATTPLADDFKIEGVRILQYVVYVKEKAGVTAPAEGENS